LSEIPASFLLPLGAAVFIGSVLLTGLMIRINIPDTPNDRSAHTQATPKSGGVAIAMVACPALAAVGLLDGTVAGGGQLVSMAVIAALIAVFFLVDDIRNLSVPVKLSGQICAALAFVATVGHVDQLWLPGLGMLEFGPWGYPLTVLWIVGFMNTFNFLDGVHGLAAGGALVAALFLGLIAYLSHAGLILSCCAILFAGVLGFFVFNFPSGRIFMGDVGSQLLGFLFAGLAVLGTAAEPERISFYVVPILFYGFIFDAVLTIFVRFARGRNIFTSHRDHLFQICHRLGLSPLRICAIHLGLFLVNGIAAMLAQRGAPWQRLYLVLLLLPLHGAYAAIVYRAGRRCGVLDVRDRTDPRSDEHRGDASD
jgi:UDP-GlcNAc:undecaprenyl-phosphate GlcNAc-1-phosphate transferase